MEELYAKIGQYLPDFQTTPIWDILLIPFLIIYLAQPLNYFNLFLWWVIPAGLGFLFYLIYLVFAVICLRGVKTQSKKARDRVKVLGYIALIFFPIGTLLGIAILRQFRIKNINSLPPSEAVSDTKKGA